MTRKEELALEILEGLKEVKPAQRKAWRDWATETFADDPGTLNFVNQVYSMANEQEGGAATIRGVTNQDQRRPMSADAKKRRTHTPKFKRNDPHPILLSDGKLKLKYGQIRALHGQALYCG